MGPQYIRALDDASSNCPAPDPRGVLTISVRQASALCYLIKICGSDYCLCSLPVLTGKDKRLIRVKKAQGVFSQWGSNCSYLTYTRFLQSFNPEYIRESMQPDKGRYLGRSNSTLVCKRRCWQADNCPVCRQKLPFATRISTLQKPGSNSKYQQTSLFKCAVKESGSKTYSPAAAQSDIFFTCLVYWLIEIG